MFTGHIRVFAVSHVALEPDVAQACFKGFPAHIRIKTFNENQFTNKWALNLTKYFFYNEKKVKSCKQLKINSVIEPFSDLVFKREWEETHILCILMFNWTESVLLNRVGLIEPNFK